MSRNGMLIALGVLIILAPLSGLPLSAWRLLEIIFGVGVFSIGLSTRASEARNQQKAVEASLPLSTPPAPSAATPPSGVSPI